MSQDQQPEARIFGRVADAYERGRPGYPGEAAVWLTGAEPLTVLELGAGTGKLTEQLWALGHDVHATEPDAAMLEILKTRLPDVRASQTGAEEIPAPDRSYDVVVAAQSFHWFDHDRALPEIARVLKAGGRLSVVWNTRDESIPWVRKLGRIIGSRDEVQPATDTLALSPLFGFLDSTTFAHWQTVDRRTIQDLVRSRSAIAVLDEEERQAKLAELLDFYDGYGRGMDGMQLPYQTRCFKTQVLVAEEPAAATAAATGDDHADADDPPTDDDSGMLLIDFR